MALKWVLYGQGKEVVWSLKIYNISDFITFYKGLTMLSLVHCFTFKWNVDTTGEVKERYWEWLGFDSSLKEGFLSLTVTAYVVSLKRGCLYTRKMRLPLVRCGWRKGRQEGGPYLTLFPHQCSVPLSLCGLSWQGVGWTAGVPAQWLCRDSDTETEQMMGPGPMTGVL